MDVTCDRCGTVYEFDETLLSGRGTPVKCTNCGHMFKVYPRAAEGADRTTSTWRLRTREGSIDTIDSMGELQRRISAGELTPDDEIARGDEEWKKLSAIRDLERLFLAAGIRVADGRIPSPIPPVVPREEASKDSSLPPGRRPRQPTLLGVSPVQRIAQRETGAEPAPAPAPEFAPEPAPEPEPEFAPEPAPESAPEPTPEPASVQAASAASEPESPAAPEESYRSPYTRDSFAGGTSVEAEDAEFEEAPVASTSVRTSTPPPAYYEDDNDIPELPGRATSPLRWLLVIVILGGLALVAVQWDRVARLIGIGSDPALIAAGMAEGDAAIAEGHPSAYASAAEAYQRAMEAGGDGDVELIAKLSNAYALLAQAQLDRGESGAEPERFSSMAFSGAESAVDMDPRHVGAALALVDARRLAGDRAVAREELEDIRALSFSRTAEFYRVDARLSQAEADGRLENGLRSARQATELAPDGVRYLLLQARAELAAGNEEQAREALSVILEDHPQHPVAGPMLAELNTEAAEAEAAAGPEAAAETEAAPGPAAAAGTEAEAAPGPAAASGSAPEPVAKRAPEPAKVPAARKTAADDKPRPAKPARRQPAYDEYDRLAEAAGSDAFIDGRPPVLDYESNMKKGREALAAGNYTRARAYFDSALEVHPGSADAMDALGDVATAVSDYGSALRYYRVAAQRGHQDGYFKLGKTYESLGRNEEAVSAYYTYVKRRPTGKHADEARRAIKTLEPRAKLPPEPETKSAPEEAPEPAEPAAQESEPASP